MGQSKMSRRAPVNDIDPAEHTGSLSVTRTSNGREAAFDLRSLSAFTIYLALSLLFFGRALLGHFSAYHIGAGPDPGWAIWCLVWWPHAIVNGLNLFVTHAIWAPSGFNLTWQTSIPLASAVASPLSATLGPVAAFNILCLLSTPLDAWCAFIFCRYLSRSYWASLLGGYIFGFSAFFLGHQIFGDLVFLVVFSVPLAVYFATRLIAREMTERRCAVVLTALLVMQFLLSLEIVATMTICAAISLLLGWSFAKSDLRQRLITLLKPIAYSYGLSMIIVSPYLYYFFASGFTREPLWSSSLSADLLNFFIPTRTNELGRFPFFEAASLRFGSIAESGAYLSLPLLMIVVLYARRHWREPLGRLLVDFLIIVSIFSLGPVLHIAGREIPSYLPWQFFERLPIVNDILVVRFSMYAFFDLAIIASLWFASTDTSQSFRLGFAALVVFFTLPNLSGVFWATTVDTPLFFRSNAYSHYLSKGETALILPYGDNGNDMLWQAQTDMYFSMPQGMAAPVFRMNERGRWPIVNAFFEDSYVPDSSEQLKAFLAAHHVDSVIVADDEIRAWHPLLSTLGVPPIRVGGISLYRLSQKEMHDWERESLEMSTRFEIERLYTLVAVGEKYLSNGGDLRSLNVVKARDFNLIPQNSLFGPKVRFSSNLARNPQLITDPRFAYGVWLSSWSGDRVAVGEYVWYPKPLIAKLRGVASEIYFPFPNRLSSDTPLPDTQTYGFLMMIFDREELGRAAQLLNGTPPHGTSPAVNLSVAPPREQNPQ